MGDFGTIEIFTQKLSYYPNEEVNGYVSVQLDKPFKGSKVFMVLSGEIYCKYFLHRLNEKNRWEDYNVIESKKSLLTLKSVLHDFKSPVITAGQYKIKFSFRLPENIQYNTTNCKGSYGLEKDESQHYLMHVKYWLQSYMYSDDSKETIAQKSSFIVKTNTLDPAEKIKNTRINHNICYCISQGFTQIKIELNKTHFRAKEMLTAKIYVDNSTTSKKISKVVCRVYRKFHVVKGNFEITKDFKEESFKGVDGSQKDYFQFSCALPVALSVSHTSEICSVTYLVSAIAYYGDDKQMAENEFIVLPDEQAMDNLDQDDDSSDKGDDYRELSSGPLNWKKCKSQLEQQGGDFKTLPDEQ